MLKYSFLESVLAEVQEEGMSINKEYFQCSLKLLNCNQCPFSDFLLSFS